MAEFAHELMAVLFQEKRAKVQARAVILAKPTYGVLDKCGLLC